MKPNTQALAITTRLISCSPAPIRRYRYPINIAFSVALHHSPKRMFVFMVARKKRK